jgi:hypothetical protein
MLDESRANASDSKPEKSNSREHDGYRQRPRPLKRSRYAKEAELAEQRQQAAEARSKAREERDKDRRAMAKARKPDKDGKYRLGRQSKVLLNRVERIVGE